MTNPVTTTQTVSRCDDAYRVTVDVTLDAAQVAQLVDVVQPYHAAAIETGLHDLALAFIGLVLAKGAKTDAAPVAPTEGE